jgi:hypothetical protein
VADDLEYSAANCVRCGQALLFMGTRDFHEGTRWGVLGELAELFVRAF